MRKKISSSVILLLLTVPWYADAQNLTESCPAPPETSEERKVLAGDWFSKGEQLVQEEDYAKAVKSFNCSLKMVPHPSTLYNAAKAADLATDNAEAILLYEQYLADYPDGDKTGVITSRLKVLEEIEKERIRIIEAARLEAARAMANGSKLAENNNQDQTNGASAGSSGEQNLNPNSADKTIFGNKNSAITVPGYVALGIGGAGVLTGAVLQIMAAESLKQGQELENIAEFERAQEKVEQYQTGALVGFIAGGTTLIAGFVLVMIDHANNQPNDKISFTPTSNGFLIRGRF